MYKIVAAGTKILDEHQSLWAAAIEVGLNFYRIIQNIKFCLIFYIFY